MLLQGDTAAPNRARMQSVSQSLLALSSLSLSWQWAGRQAGTRIQLAGANRSLVRKPTDRPRPIMNLRFLHRWRSKASALGRSVGHLVKEASLPAPDLPGWHFLITRLISCQSVTSRRRKGGRAACGRREGGKMGASVRRCNRSQLPSPLRVAVSHCFNSE